MPLSEGAKWTYLVRAVSSYPDAVMVKRQVAVGDAQGYEMQGRMGVYHLAWDKGRLVTDMMATARFIPPLILLAPHQKTTRWSGWVLSDDKRIPAKATITNSPQKLDLLGNPVETTRSDVTVNLAGQNLTLSTWFQPSVGIVRQEQRTNGRIDLTLEYLGR